MRRFLPGKKSCCWCLAILTLLGLVGYWQKDRILTWHYLNQLAAADEANQEAWASRVVARGEPAVPSLLARLTDASDSSANNLGHALSGLLLAWGPDDERSHRTLSAVVEGFASFSAEGQKVCLRSVRNLIDESAVSNKLPAEVAKSAGDLLSRSRNQEPLLYGALRLAASLMPRVPPGQACDLCRTLAAQGLDSERHGTRLAAIQVLLSPSLREDKALLTKLVPLLTDKEEDVRLAALVALAPESDLVDDDDLLPLLHDASPVVQQHCVLALESRGLTESQIFLAKLISDPRPGVRLQVLEHLDRVPDLEPGVWLQRLSQDTAPAVRAAAVRAAATEGLVDLQGRLTDMARGDPSPTVRQLAAFYLSRPMRRDRDD